MFFERCLEGVVKVSAFKENAFYPTGLSCLHVTFFVANHETVIAVDWPL